MNTKVLAAAAAGIMVLTPVIASAQAQRVSSFCDILRVFNTALSWFGILVFIVAVAAILYAAFLFLTAGGNEDTLKSAKTVLVYGIVGIVIALLATNAIRIISATTGGAFFRVSDCQTEPLNTNLIQ